MADILFAVFHVGCGHRGLFTDKCILRMFPRPLKMTTGQPHRLQIHPIGYFDHGGTGSMLGGVSPGKRWKFSVVTDGRSMMLFGGMTLWEGFLPSSSSSSSASKNYPSEATANAPPTTKFVGGSKKPGGFLDDMWVFRKRLLTRGWGGINNFLEDVQGDFTDPRNDGGPDPENYASQGRRTPSTRATSGSGRR